MNFKLSTLNTFNFKYSLIIIPFAFFILAFYNAGCQRRIDYDGFDSTKLFSLSELYTIKSFRSLDEALKQPDSVYKLILFGKTYDWVPDEVYSFKYLNTLELSKNNLSTLPNYIGDMIYLQGLYLSENEFTDIPNVIYCLPNLKRLRFGDNKFEFIPKKLLEKKCLEELYFGGNQIGELPDEIFNMLQIKVIDLNNNKISDLKPNVSRLKNLEVLILKNNQLKNIPFEELLSLENLRILNLKGNNISFKILDSLRKAMPNTKIDY